MKKILLFICSLTMFLSFNINAYADTGIPLTGTYYFCFGSTFAYINGSSNIVSGDVSCDFNYSGNINTITARFLPSANYPSSGDTILFGSVNTFDVTLTPSTSLTTGNTYKLDIVLFNSSTNGHRLELYTAGSFQGWNGSTWSSNYISSKSISTSYDKGSGKVYISILFTLSNNVSKIFYQMKAPTIGPWVWNSNVSTDNAYYFISSNLVKVDNPSDALLEEQINQNNTIINQNEETNQNLEDINDSLTDETPPDTSEYGDVAGWLPSGTVDTLVNLPLSLLTSINNNANKSCSPYVMPFFNNTTITFPCIGTYLESLSGWRNLIGILDLCIAGILLYKLLMSLYKDIQKLLSLHVSDSDLGGVD